MLEVQGLRGGWGPTIVIENFSLCIESGDCVSIVGRNGVGKTTFLELLVGRANHMAGRILIESKDVSSLAPHMRALAGFAYVPQAREIFPSLTVLENVAIGKRAGPWTEESVFELFPGLRNRRDNLGGQLSGGEQQMLAIGRALMTNPKVLIMDEPTEGLAPVVIDQLVASLEQIVADRSLTVVLVEQRIDVAIQLSSRCIVMDRGEIVHDGPSQALARAGDKLASLIGLGEMAAQ